MLLVVQAVGLLVVAAGVGSAVWFGVLKAKPAAPPSQPVAADTKPTDAVRRTGVNDLVVPEAVAARIGLGVATAKAPTRPRALPPFSGTLTNDTSRLTQVHSLFAGEVVALGTPDGQSDTSRMSAAAGLDARGLRSPDRVTRGQLLAVVWSKDLLEKKSELVDAISRSRAAAQILDRLRGASKTGSIPPRSVWDAERDAEAARVAEEKAERTLLAWKVPAADVAAVRAEADRLSKPGAAPVDPAAWARVEIRAPQDGVLIEVNTFPSHVVDPSLVLFQIADMTRLAVWAHVYDEDLPAVEALPTPVRWTVAVPSRPGTAYPGTLDSIRPVIDQNQRTALVVGSVENPKGDLRIGTPVTVTVDIPPGPGEVEVPPEGVVEDGRESVVFVRSAADPTRVVRHPVKVLRRYRDAIYLAAEPGKVNPGDQVVTAGSLLLNGVMSEQPVPPAAGR